MTSSTAASPRAPRFARILLVALAAIAYANGLHDAWVYDDIALIQNTPAIDDPRMMRHLFTSKYGWTFGELTYRPVGTLVLFVDGVVFHRDPVLSHGLNLVLHAALGLFLFQLWSRFYRREGLAWTAAALFVCHPLTTEVVNCAGFRREILWAIGLAIALQLAAATLTVSSRRAAIGFGAASGVVLLLSLLTKESAITALVLAPVALAAAVPVRRAWRANRARVLRRAVALGGVGAGAVAIWVVLYLTLSYPGDPDSWADFGGPVLGLLSFGRAFLLYARLWIAPIGLSAGHYFEPATAYFDARAWVGLTAFGGVAALSLAALITKRGRLQIVGVGGLWCCLAMGPFTQIVPAPAMVAERWLYVPLAGASLAAAAGLDALRARLVLRGRWGAATWWAATTLVFAVLVGLTQYRNRDWSDATTLAIRRFEAWPEDDARSRMALGMLEANRGDIETAERYLTRAVALDPDLADAHDGLAFVAHKQGRVDEAHAHRRRATELRSARGETRKRGARQRRADALWRARSEDEAQ